MFELGLSVTLNECEVMDLRQSCFPFKVYLDVSIYQTLDQLDQDGFYSNLVSFFRVYFLITHMRVLL